jgi:hypothetical protein
MRLIDIQEELEGSNVTKEELLKLIYDTLYNIKTHRVPVTNGQVTIHISRSDLMEKQELQIGVAFYPTEPECNENMFKEPMEYFLRELFNMLENTLKKTDPTILSGINISYYGYNMYYKEGIINFMSRDYLTPSDQAMLRANIRLGDAYIDMDFALQDLVIPMDRLVKFSPEYGLAMDKAIKKMNTIYKAYEKGTYEGKPYQLSKHPTMTVIQLQDGWDPDSRVLLPTFELSINTGKIDYDGDTTNLQSILKKRFESFNINFR